MHKRQLIRKKPAYFRGQLLLEDDFVAEQRYHAEARYRHNLNLHGWGIARGLEVTAAGDSAVSVSPGFAIDSKGHEIEIRQAEVLELSSLPPNSSIHIALAYDEDLPPAGEIEKPRIKCYAVLSASTGTAEGTVLLAIVQLDERGKLSADSISTDTVHLLGRRGWLRMPFRPVEQPQDDKDSRPPFRIGPTQAVSHKFYPDEKTQNTRGAAGTMTIPLLPDITRIHRLRIAGSTNEKQIEVSLWLGGWDEKQKEHIARELLNRKIAGTGEPYDETFKIENGDIDSETHTLSIEVRSEGYAKVSLVAIELSY